MVLHREKTMALVLRSVRVLAETEVWTVVHTAKTRQTLFYRRPVEARSTQVLGGAPPKGRAH